VMLFATFRCWPSRFQGGLFSSSYVNSSTILLLLRSFQVRRNRCRKVSSCAIVARAVQLAICGCRDGPVRRPKGRTVLGWGSCHRGCAAAHVRPVRGDVIARVDRLVDVAALQPWQICVRSPCPCKAASLSRSGGYGGGADGLPMRSIISAQSMRCRRCSHLSWRESPSARHSKPRTEVRSLLISRG
jgi:hypothetical protein